MLSINSNSRTTFNFSQELICNGKISVESGEKEKELFSSFTPKEIEKKLNVIEDKLVDDSRNIIFDSLYFDIKDILNSFLELTTGSKLKLIGLLQSSFSKHVQTLKLALSNSKNFESSEWRLACEMYSVILFKAVSAAESVGSDKSKTSGGGTSNLGIKSKAVIASTTFDWGHIKIALLENLKTFASLSLGRIFESSSDRESITNCIVKAAHKILENPENVIKSLNTRKAALEVLSECAKSQGYGQGLKTFILQDLIYAEHLAEPIAELMKLLYANEDSGCAQTCEDILKSVGSQRYNSQESTTSTKLAAMFLAKFAAICPKEALRTLSLFIEQLDSEAYLLRMTMVEVIGLLIYYLMTQEDRSDSVKAQTKSLFAALEERFYDVNSFVRSKTLQICCDLSKSASIPVTKRPKLLQLAAERVMDKSSNVRRKAIQLLGDFLRTHPFGVDGGELNLTFFETRLSDIERLINELAPVKTEKSNYLLDIDMEVDPDSEQKQLGIVDNSVRIGSLLAQKQYYIDAVKFVTVINEIIPTICLLLSSTTKTELFEVMEFLVDAHIYKLETAEKGIKKMLHLIWEKELSSEDGTKQSVKEHLIENYRRIYLFADDQIPPKDRFIAIARNLIKMIEGISIADLASLSELFSCFVKKNLIAEQVIQQIFVIFASNEFDKTSRRSALILISIISKSRKDIVEKRLETLLKLGLGPLGQADPLIAQYTLISLQSLSLSSSGSSRIPSENVLFGRISNFILSICNSSRWFSVINQAITTIFLLADRPAILLSKILIAQHRIVFNNNTCNNNNSDTYNNNNNNQQISSKIQLGKLILMIGQVAACVSDHLDVIERYGKETAQKLDESTATGADADLAKVSASAEDDFSELVKGVREHEVLFGPNSILTILGPLVIKVCTNNSIFNDEKMQRIATLALSKLMTVSSIFCERNLQIFLTILEKSQDAIVRSNLVIAFGDLAQGFNRLVEQNIDYLFNRLRDQDLTVRRNTLMVLTHLSLCGMIKVKGQIGEISKCLIDSDSRIRNLSRIFFSELADRGEAGSGIYNLIPDILSHLSAEGIKNEIDEESFKNIMKFIFEFIKKEKQMESLIEKLCARFRHSDNLRHSRDLSFCLSLISFSGDRSLKKLAEAFPLYQDKLVDEKVLGNFVEILNRSKKFCKPEMKPLVDELELRLLQAANGNLQRTGEGGVVASFAALSQSISKAAKSAASASSKVSNNSKKLKSKKKTKNYTDETTDEDDEEEDYDYEKESKSNEKPKPKPKARRSAAISVNKYIDDESSEPEIDFEPENNNQISRNIHNNNSTSRSLKGKSNQLRNNNKKKLVVNDDDDDIINDEADIF